MIPGLIGAGMGLGLAGSALGAYGQGQAAKSMADVRRRQIAEQQGLQNEGMQNARGFVAANNPESMLAGAYGTQNSVAQNELAKLGAAGQQAGLGAGNAGATLASLQNTNMGHQANQAQLAAPELAQHHYQMRLSDLSNKQSALERQAAQRAALYDQQLQLAGMSGMGSRTLGSLAQLGGAGLSMAGSLMDPTAAATDLAPSAADASEVTAMEEEVPGSRDIMHGGGPDPWSAPAAPAVKAAPILAAPRTFGPRLPHGRAIQYYQ